MESPLPVVQPITIDLTKASAAGASIQCLLTLVLLTLMTPDGRCDDSFSREPNFSLKVPLNPAGFSYALKDAFGDVVIGSRKPVVITTPSLETNRIFVGNQDGQIFVFPDLSNPAPALFLDIRDRTMLLGEAGLLGLAFHPGFATNRYFYVFYAASVPQENGVLMDNRLSRFEVSAVNSNQGLPESELILFSQPDYFHSHNAGDLHFGPDGCLYASLGDGGPNGNVMNAQRINKDFFSGILRIDVDQRPGSLEPNPHPSIRTNDQGKAFYSIPSDNPFVGATSFNGQPVDPATVRTEFWAVGLRNPWRMAFDSLTGQLLVGDVGSSHAEEIDIVVRGGNYGWPFLEGTNVLSVREGFESALPIASIPWGDGDYQSKALSGGVVYRGSRMPELDGAYLFSSFTGGQLWKLRPNGTNLVPFELVTSGTPLSAFGVDPRNGDILGAAYNEGKIKRLVKVVDPNGGSFPGFLSAVGAFRDLTTLEPEAGIMPYEVNVPFWSDHALKRRWFSIPDTNQKMTFSASGSWLFPTGTVWIKHFELELTNGAPESIRRLETRFLVKNSEGVHGFTYRWNTAQTDAGLVEAGGQDETIAVYRPDGSLFRNQTWRYPGRSECLQCHTPLGGHALGFNAAQLNRSHDYGDGLTNQIGRLDVMGYFDGALPAPETLPHLAPAGDVSVSVERRVRSYFQANCVQCHQPGGVVQGTWDARITTPLESARILNGELLNNYGEMANRVIRPGSLDQSILFRRVSQPGPGHMPPVATSEMNEEAIGLLREWIAACAGTVAATWNADGSILLRYFGEPGRTYRIESSTDLMVWQMAAEATADVSGKVEHREPADAQTGSRFYRVVWP